MVWLNVLRVMTVVTLVSTRSKADVFTALVDLEPLVLTEGEIVKTLGIYLKAEEKRLQKLRRFKEDYQKQYLAASQDAQSYLSNPVNSFLLVKRLTADWQSVKDLINSSDSTALIRHITSDELTFPDEEDLSGSASALFRLQDTYLLDAFDLAKGEVGDAKSSVYLSADDCFLLGKQAYKTADYYHTFLWMQVALDRFLKENNKTAETIDALNHMAYCTYMLGNIEHAVSLTQAILEIDPGRIDARENADFYKTEFDKLKEEGGINGKTPVEPAEFSLGTKLPAPESSPYEKLCRGEKVKVAAAAESKLYCRYTTNNSPYLLLQPVEEEELNLKPRIVVYHDVLTDREMDVIKNISQSKLRRATVFAPGGIETFANYRISKSAWLKDNVDDVLGRVSQRIEDITGLEMDVAEELQVVNYGIGGHYEPHYDFARKEETSFEYLGTGNRIATWLTYMSDVDAGGATVFTKIGVHVKPKKGSAAFWYNLLENGKRDFDTMHAACPVLVGSKWVANKWIHERSQEFRRRCNLDPNK